MRHILRTMVNVDLLFQQLRKENELPENFDYETLIWTAALHDAIEINQENGGQLTREQLKEKLINNGVDDEKAEKISQLVSFLTPEKTNHKKTAKEKRKKFNRIWDGEGLADEGKQLWQKNQIYLRIVKAADVLANLFETSDDINKRKEDGRMGRSLEERYEEFEYRIGKIRVEGFNIFGADSWLQTLSDKIKKKD